jgi:hypothetical protein
LIIISGVLWNLRAEAIKMTKLARATPTS